MHKQLDADTLQKALNGDAFAFEKMVETYSKPIYFIAFRMFNNPEDAKDICQEVFMKLYKHKGKKPQPQDFFKFVYRVTINCCIDEARKRKGKTCANLDDFAELSANITPEDIAIKNENNVRLKAAIASLPDAYKTVVILRDILGLSYADTAEVVGYNIGTLKSKLSRARNRLRKLLDNPCV